MSITDSLALKGQYRIQMHDAASGLLVSERVYDNVICGNGKAYIAGWLNQEIGTNGIVYGATGDSFVAPLAGDTGLGHELARNPLAVNVRAFNVLTWSFFFTTTQSNATLAEAGVFIGGTASVNTGNILSHVVINEVKDSSKTLTLQWTFTIG